MILDGRSRSPGSGVDMLKGVENVTENQHGRSPGFVVDTLICYKIYDSC